jgi:uncharacterized protein involved in copper resistance
MKRFLLIGLASLLIMSSLGHVFAAAFCPRALGRECCFANTSSHGHTSPSTHEDMAMHGMPMEGMTMDDMAMDNMATDETAMEDTMTLSQSGLPREHAPPGSSAPRHILIGVFLI